MEKKYCCTNPECCKKDREGFTMVLAMESIMDEKNVAQMFCPHCKAPLVFCDETKETPCC